MDEERLEQPTEETVIHPAEESVAEAEEQDAQRQALQQELESARGRVRQLEHERILLSRGVPEEDLDYYLFKIEKLVTGEKDFAAAAKEFLKTKRPLLQKTTSTGASLSGGTARAESPGETMNRLIRGE